MEYTASLVRLKTDARIAAMRESAKDRRDPVCADETLNYLLYTVKSLRPRRILEIGTAEGLSGAAMLSALPDAVLTTVEIDEALYLRAKKNFEEFGLSSRAHCILGDAAGVLNALDGTFDLVFLDGPKAQYLKYLPDIKRLLREGGVLFADDVLLYGWVSGKVPVPQKRHSIVAKLREYLDAVSRDEELITSVLDIGEGVAVSVKVSSK